MKTVHIINGKRIAEPGVVFVHEGGGPRRSCDACLSGSRVVDSELRFEHADECPAARDALWRLGEEP
jgi:hypothetical protein